MDKKRKQQYLIVSAIIAVVLVVDQVIKIWVKTNFYIGEERPLIGDWCLLHFTENEGFAFGMAFGGTVGKILLSLFRLVASAAIMWYLLRQIKRGMRTGLAACLALIFAGAVGNLIDSIFYGLIFNESYYSVASFFPAEGGYAPLLQGRVVDMFSFPIIDSVFPEWVPFLGGRPFVFFNAIFNFADAAVSVGAFWLIIDQLCHAKKDKKEDSEDQKNTPCASSPAKKSV